MTITLHAYVFCSSILLMNTRHYIITYRTQSMSFNNRDVNTWIEQ